MTIASTIDEADATSVPAESDYVSNGTEPDPKTYSPSRASRRADMRNGTRILKMHFKGNSPRKIARMLGYLNVDQGERSVREFIHSVLK